MLALLISSSLESQIICAVKKHILCGGPNRLPFTVPPLMFSALSVCFSCLICKKALFHVYSRWLKNLSVGELAFKSWSIMTYNLLMFRVLILLEPSSFDLCSGFVTHDAFTYAIISFEVKIYSSLNIRYLYIIFSHVCS